MARSKSCFENDTRELIKILTGFKTDEENFGRCMQYALSNFKYHRFLDINSHQTEQVLRGMRHKFLVHSQASKADSFDALTDLFLHSLSYEGCERVKTDTHYSLLSLLLNLADSPTNSDFSRLPPDGDTEEPVDAFDWPKYLLEGDEIHRPWLSASSPEWSEDEDEVMTDDDDEEEGEEGGRGVHWPSAMTDSGVAATPVDDIVVVIPAHSAPWRAPVEAARAALQQSVTPDYWAAPHGRPVTDRPGGQRWSHVTAMHDAGQVLMSEHHVVRESLCVLGGVTGSFVFRREADGWRVNPTVCVAHLSRGSLGAVLARVTRYGDIVVKLDAFVDAVVGETGGAAGVSRTYQAFGASLSCVLRAYRQQLVAVEKEVQSQVLPVSLVSLLARLAGELRTLELVDRVYRRGVEGEGVDTRPGGGAAGRATRLLAALYDLLLEADARGGGGDEVAVLFPMWLSTCRPYLDIIDRWMTTGRLRDARSEFIIRRDPDVAPTSEHFWSDALTPQGDGDDGDDGRTDARDAAAAAVQAPVFLKPILGAILAVGKSVEVLRNMEPAADTAAMVGDRRSLYDTFIASLRAHAPADGGAAMWSRPELTADGGAARWPRPAFTTDVDRRLQTAGVADALLQANFRRVFGGATCQPDASSPPPPQSAVRPSSPPPADRLTPVDRLLQQSLHPAVARRCDSVSRHLLVRLTDTCHLQRYFDAVRRFFLLEAGDTMYQFYTEIFEKLQRDEPWSDQFFLNDALQRALQMRFPEEADRLFVTVEDAEKGSKTTQPIDALNGLTLHYKIPWPLNMVLDSQCVAIYNDVFRFLLQIKRALYALHHLSFSDLEKARPLVELIEPWRPLAEAPATPVCRRDLVHRVQIFRMRLLHFVNSLHNYMMTRIVHSTEAECARRVHAARDLDAVLSARRQHARHLHARCLRAHSLFSGLIGRVLGLALCLQRHWRDGADRLSEKTLDDLQSTFTKCTQFLSSFLNNVIKRGSFPHLESLAFALVTSNE